MSFIKKDSFIAGFIPGLIFPVIGFYCYFLLFFNYMDFHGFYHLLVKSDKVVSVMSLGVILNLIVFFVFYQLEADKSLRGVIAATFIYAFIVVYFKVF